MASTKIVTRQIADDAVTAAQIADGAIINAAIASDAAIALSKLATDPLARANHTGSQAATTISDLATVVKAYRLDEFAVPTSSVAMNSQKLTGLANGTANGDGVNYGQLLGAVNGLAWKAPVRVVAASNQSLSTGPADGDTIDGVTLAAGDRILLAGQTDPTENGIYVVDITSTPPTRASDYAAGADGHNATVLVSAGTTYADTQWTCTTNHSAGDTVGTDGLAFAQIGSGTSYTADGSTIQLVGTEFSVPDGGITQAKLAFAFSTLETPSGTVNGSNADFVLANTPATNSLDVFLNGILQEPGSGNDYTLATATITFETAPISGDKIRCRYRYAV